MSGETINSPHRHDYSDPFQLAEALAENVAGHLVAALETTGEASLAVSGGSTPVRFFEALARHDLDWKNVSVTLVDERWVSADDPRSNAGLVARHLLKGPAGNAKFVPLYSGAETPDAGLADVERQLRTVTKPFSVIVLGMGSDGHTASFFPGGDHLSAALDPVNSALVIPMQASGAGEPRITLTFSALMDARQIYLHIEGREKHDVLDAALAGGPDDDMPVRALLRQSNVPLTVYWAPTAQ